MWPSCMQLIQQFDKWVASISPVELNAMKKHLNIEVAIHHLGTIGPDHDPWQTLKLIRFKHNAFQRSFTDSCNWIVHNQTTNLFWSMNWDTNRLCEIPERKYPKSTWYMPLYFLAFATNFKSNWKCRTNIVCFSCMANGISAAFSYCVFMKYSFIFPSVCVFMQRIRSESC